jgi:hypothetical protein
MHSICNNCLKLGKLRIMLDRMYRRFLDILVMKPYNSPVDSPTSVLRNHLLLHIWTTLLGTSDMSAWTLRNPCLLGLRASLLRLCLLPDLLASLLRLCLLPDLRASLLRLFLWPDPQEHKASRQLSPIHRDNRGWMRRKPIWLHHRMLLWMWSVSYKTRPQLLSL